LRKTQSSPAAVAALLVGLLVLAAPVRAAETAKVDIPFQKFTLDNGLVLLVHEDHKAPIVAFNVWYHVGSKNEVAGKTGFAHLFEHLMFNGSENYNDDYFKPMQKIGATDLNGTTNEDRTNYFENVPVSALDLVLWMESDRMGHLKGAISQAKLDEQRGVVQNELRQYHNEPYSVAEELIIRGTYPPGHPYSWPVVGSIEDLSNAKLDDVHKWFSSYYGPNNAVVVVAGDIDAKTALEKVKKYFGDIPPSPPISRHATWVAKRTGTHRENAQDRVPQARIYKVWNVPGWGTMCADNLNLVSSILADGKTSRLYKRLVYDDQLATSVKAYIDEREIAGLFTIQADAKPGVELSKVEKAIDEELAKFLAEGPTAKELERVKTQFAAGFVKGVERIGGFGGKSDILASSMVNGGSPDAIAIETMVEIKNELEGILGKKPITNDEFNNAKNSKVLGLPGRWETMAAVQASLGEIVSYGFPDDYYQKYSARVQKLTIEDLAKAAKKTVHPEAVTWVVVGDRAQIEPKIRELGFTDIFVIDADGNVIK